MDTIIISPLKKAPTVRFSGEMLVLPPDSQCVIDAYWQSLIDAGKSYTRGEVFTITQVNDTSGNLSLLVERTDYAHYLYCQNKDADLNGYGIRIVFTACLVETADDKIIFGKMGDHTARSGIYQLSGGGIDKTDLVGNHFDLEGSITREVAEELGIDVDDPERVKDFSAAYLKQGGLTRKIAVVYRLRLLETADVFLERYGVFRKQLEKQHEVPEFGEIVVVEKNKASLEDFFARHRDECDEYMEPLLQYAYIP